MKLVKEKKSAFFVTFILFKRNFFQHLCFISMYSVFNKLSEYIYFWIYFFIHFCCAFLKSSKAFSVSLIRLYRSINIAICKTHTGKTFSPLNTSVSSGWTLQIHWSPRLVHMTMVSLAYIQIVFRNFYVILWVEFQKALNVKFFPYSSNMFITGTGTDSSFEIDRGSSIKVAGKLHWITSGGSILKLFFCIL